jgi:hypothetical protein
MTMQIGYPDYFDDENAAKLEKDYAEVRYKSIFIFHIHHVSNTVICNLHYNFKSSSSFLQNIFLLMKADAKISLRILREPIDRKLWFLPPTVVNAFYIFPYNSLSESNVFFPLIVNSFVFF